MEFAQANGCFSLSNGIMPRSPLPHAPHRSPCYRVLPVPIAVNLLDAEASPGILPKLRPDQLLPFVRRRRLDPRRQYLFQV